MRPNPRRLRDTSQTSAQDLHNMSVPMCPAVSYTVGRWKVLKAQLEAQKPHVIEQATPRVSVRFESCRGHYLTSMFT